MQLELESVSLDFCSDKDFTYSLADCVSSGKFFQLLAKQLCFLGFVCFVFLGHMSQQTCQRGASFCHLCTGLSWGYHWEVLHCTARTLCSSQELQHF